MDELTFLEARYDAMPPEIVRYLRSGNQDSLVRRHQALQGEIAFARRMFRTNLRASKRLPASNLCRSESQRANPYRDDCRRWWHRYRKARASAHDVRRLIMLRGRLADLVP